MALIQRRESHGLAPVLLAISGFYHEIRLQIRDGQVTDTGAEGWKEYRRACRIWPKGQSVQRILGPIAAFLTTKIGRN